MTNTKTVALDFYILGRLASIIALNDDDEADAVFNQLLSDPAQGLPTLLMHPRAKPLHAQLHEWVCQLEDLSVITPGPRRPLEKAAFWAGVSGPSGYDPMEPTAHLNWYGCMLYGPNWKRPLGQFLGYSDGRVASFWVRGERPVPDGVWAILDKAHGEKLIDMLSHTLG